MKNSISLILSLAVTLFFSCSSNTHKQEEKKEEQTKTVMADEHFAPGQLIDKVVCKADTSQSYALYLPSTYSNDKQYPVLYAFDPHGTGKLPVSNYKDLAEKYNYILVGSNNSKNGINWEEIQKIANQFFADVQSRFHVNTQRIYSLGFSGGARIANALAMNNGSITGVICCGAASPTAISPNPRNNYYFMGIAGNADFNYIEIKKYDKVDLAGHNIKHGLLIFDGKHEWPPLSTMDEALWWMELNEKRKNAVKNDSTVNKNIQLAAQELQSFLDKKQMLAAYECCRKTINFYEGLGDLTLFYSTYQTLQTNKEIDKALQNEEASWAQEESIKKKYMEAVQSNDANWWKKDIASLNNKIKKGPPNEVLINKRILSFLSLMMYLQTTEFMKQRNTAAADYFSKLYLLVDPDNSEAHYLAAELNAIQGNQTDAINFLNSAIKNGFTDKARLENDKAFIQMNKRAEFQKIAGEIKG